MHLFYYIRLDGRDPDGSEQRAILAKFDPPGRVSRSEYVEEAKRVVGQYPRRNALVRAIRKKSDLVVVADFWRLASRTGDLADAVEAIRGRKDADGEKLRVVIVEARTGFRSDCQTQLVRMMEKATNVYAGRSLSPERAREMGRLGSEASPATKPKGGRMPYRQMAKIINAAPTLAAAIEEINATDYEPVTKIWLYRAKRAGKLIFKKRRGATGAKPST